MGVNLLICRPGFEDALVEELADRGIRDVARIPRTPGLVGPVRHEQTALPVCVFERQRIPEPGFLPAERLKPIGEPAVRFVFGPLLLEPAPWSLHCYTVAEGLGRRAAGIAGVLQRQAIRIAPSLRTLQCGPGRERPETLVLQLCLAKTGLWYGTGPAAALSHPAPGGMGRYRLDPRSPSRSYLKIEEALAMLGVEPAAGETVVDLGAAPGGWSLAFLKRGCRVTAVDHGDLRIPAEFSHRLVHRRENGLRFRLDRDQEPLDWLACDMLIPPGPALGVLKYWVGERRTRHFICNIKIPQQHPQEAIRPLAAWLHSLQGVRYMLRQTYHDRREVTVMGMCMV